uniref:Uncharacterized protein TCIL3000_11_2510 n=1 Tax=Trypanosoma congolense (strain IL3000) TaxID=1068625 RepID=G0UZP0_TRYCI|nr:unnamed protein product [Trypanosoma congolense IL3000]
MIPHRRKEAIVKEQPSLTWHLMSEEYHPMFVAGSSERIEYWYNKIATRVQRESFRRICKEIFYQQQDRESPHFDQLYSEQYCRCEAETMIRYYGSLLTAFGKKAAQNWIMHDASGRDKTLFTEVFTALQVSFVPKSVMKTDFVTPNKEAYEGIDRSNFLSSIDWYNPESKRNLPRVDRIRFGTAVGPTQRRATERVIRRRGQFEGVSPLVALGYTGDMEEEIEKLQVKQQQGEESERYYTVDGCTVYVAGGRKKDHGSTSRNRVIATFFGD